MKKVIFISALAIAAAVSCTKSDIVDTKFGNDAIGFQTYVGHDAQTKATEVDYEALQNSEGFGVYGIYTAAVKYDGDDKVNLFKDEQVKWGKPTSDASDCWYYTNTRYWTNDDDWYTFLAYAPYGETALVGKMNEGDIQPYIEYTVDSDITDQIDVLYATPIETQKPDNGEVPFAFNHILSRLTVTAAAGETYTDGYSFTINDIKLSGNFVKKATFDLYQQPASW